MHIMYKLNTLYYIDEQYCILLEFSSVLVLYIKCISLIYKMHYILKLYAIKIIKKHTYT